MGKQLIFDVLNHKEGNRPAWVPFAGIHAGKLMGYSAREILTDGDKLLQSLLKVNELYRPDGQPILFDLQVEAEILGCELKWAEDSPPTVSTHPLSENMIVPCRCKMPTMRDGRLPMILDTMKKMSENVGDKTALYGLVVGPFTLASHLRGTDIFMDMFDEPEYVAELIAFCTDFINTVAGFYIDAGMDVIAVVDPLVSQISASHFQEFLNEPFTKIFDYIRSRNKFSSFFVCGDASRNIEEMCKTTPDCISVDENIKLENIRDITQKYNVVLSGNIPLTTVMLHGTQTDNMKYVVELIKKVTNPNRNFIVSPGCDMPYAVPIENTIGAAQAVIEFDRIAELVKDYDASATFNIPVELPDYANLKKPFVEVFTLDSASCAACTYMYDAAQKAVASFGGAVDIIEYKFTIKENIARCVKMGIKNLPSLYINGKLIYSSIIPSLEELKKQIASVIK